MKEKKYLILGIATVLITLIGVTYAYFTTKIIGDRKNVTVDMAELKIIFTNGDSIEASDVYAEDNLDIVKTFSVENKTKNDYKYNIVIEDLVNTFKTTGYLVYKITSDDGGYNMTEFKDVPKSLNPFNTGLAYNITIPAKSIHNYNVEIKYINSETVNQSADMGKTLSGKLYIEKGSNPTLSYMMLKDNSTISTRTDFSTTFTENTTGTLFVTDKTEDGSSVYYYAGNTTNNWVKFGGFYWRIIRTNEDGSVRILYSGKSHDTVEGFIGQSLFNENNDDPMYVGYMYGTSGSLEKNRTNTNDSTIKTTIDAWYESNLLNNYDKFISKNAIYCNDRSISNGVYTINSRFYYGTYTRLESKTSTYKCGDDGNGGLFESTQAIADKFSASTSGGGNGKLKYPVALITADELIFAGGLKYTTLSSPYAWYYTNSQGESITKDRKWWTLSPSDNSNQYSHTIWMVAGNYYEDGKLYYGDNSYNYQVRPVTSLSSCVRIKSGNGTPESPYEIDYDNSCS